MKNIRIAEILVLFACLSVIALPVLNGLVIAPSFTSFLKDVAEKELVKVATKLSALIDIQADLVETTSLSQEAVEKIEAERQLLNLTKVKIFSRAGLIIYSTDAQDIGQRTRKDFFPALVAKQQTRTDLDMVDKNSPGQDVFLVETYVPIVKQGRTIGVFEIYYNMTETRLSLAKLVNAINWVVLTVSLLLLFAVLGSAYLTRRSHLLRERIEAEKDQLIKDLSEALSEIKTLRGILPLCSFCKKVRDDSGYWKQVDVYIDQNSEADISHSICPDCVVEHYPEQYDELSRQKDAAEADKTG